MNDIDLETRLRDQLPRLADFAVGASEPITPLAQVQLLEPARRPRWKVAVAAAAAVVAVAIVVAATGVFGGSDTSVLTRPQPHDTPVATEPTGPAVHTLTIKASNFHYDAVHYVVPAGITDLTLVSDAGRHALVFDQPQFAYVHLAVPDGPTSAKVDFVEGHTYGIFCTIPGHQQAGEVATITVGAPNSDTHMVVTTSTTTTSAAP